MEEKLISYKGIGVEKVAQTHYKKTGEPYVVFNRIRKALHCGFKDVKDAQRLMAESPLDLFFIHAEKC